MSGLAAEPRDEVVALGWDEYASSGPECPEDDAFAGAIDALLQHPELMLRALQAEQVCEHAQVTPRCVSCALGWAVQWIESEGY